MLKKFYKTFVAFDLESTNLDPDKAEIIQLGKVEYSVEGMMWAKSSMFFKPITPIPPECSAICNISNDMVKDAPSFNNSLETVFKYLTFDSLNTFYVGHNVRYDVETLFHSFKKAGVNFHPINTFGKSRWICTYRLARRLLVNESVPAFSLNCLRYYFNLLAPNDLLIHRADNDAFLCALLLEKLTEYAIQTNKVDSSEDMGMQLANICWESIPVDVWPMGKKYKGVPLAQLPNDFFRWALINIGELDAESYRYDSDLADAVEAELSKRDFKF